MHDVVVVGGGPAGSLVARNLAPRHDVVVLEEHGSSGTPVQCAGLLSPDVIRMSGVDPDILNTLHGAEVFFPDGTSVIVRSKAPKAVVVDRADLDGRMADAAVSAGAEYRYGERYTGHTVGDRVTVSSSSGSLDARAVVGADGHSSRVAMTLGDNGPREYLRGIQADVRMESVHDDLFTIHLGSEYAPGFFTWEIPCGDFVRVGLCTSWSAGPPYPYLSAHLRRMGAEDRILRMYSGKIPVGGRPRTYGERCLLTGDAAGLVKPVSGGGLHPTFETVPHLCRVLSSALDADDLSESNLSAYERGWRSQVGRELSWGYTLRRMFTRLDDADLVRAGGFASRDDVRSLLDDIDLDHPSRVVGAMLRRPRALLAAVPLFIRCIL